MKSDSLVKAVFDTDRGRELLAALYKSFVMVPSLTDDHDKTMYLLGQRDLVIGFMNEVMGDDLMKEVEVLYGE